MQPQFITSDILCACPNCGHWFYQSEDTVPMARFWNNVDIRGIDDCWPWIGQQIDRWGYGKLSWQGRQSNAMHVAYELVIGPIPTGYVAGHLCDIRYSLDSKLYRLCCNPWHIMPMTPTENAKDTMRKGRMAVGERHGTKTHPEKVQRGDSHWLRRRSVEDREYSTLKGRTPVGQMKSGESHPFARLNDAIVLEMRARHANGESCASLARVFGVTHETARKAISGRTWGHLVSRSV